MTFKLSYNNIIIQRSNPFKDPFIKHNLKTGLVIIRGKFQKVYFYCLSFRGSFLRGTKI
jgi:hypothetical protein